MTTLTLMKKQHSYQKKKKIYESNKQPNYFLGETALSIYTEEVAKKQIIEGYVIHIENRVAEPSNFLKLPVGSHFKEVVLSRTL